MNNATATTETPIEVKLALGRLFRMMRRPYQPGDDAMYSKIRSIVMDAHERGGGSIVDSSPNYARDRNRGAQGQ